MKPVKHPNERALPAISIPRLNINMPFVIGLFSAFHVNTEHEYTMIDRIPNPINTSINFIA